MSIKDCHQDQFQLQCEILGNKLLILTSDMQSTQSCISQFREDIHNDRDKIFCQYPKGSKMCLKLERTGKQYELHGGLNSYDQASQLE